MDKKKPLAFTFIFFTLIVLIILFVKIIYIGLGIILIYILSKYIGYKGKKEYFPSSSVYNENNKPMNITKNKYKQSDVFDITEDKNNTQAKVVSFYKINNFDDKRDELYNLFNLVFGFCFVMDIV